jgi:hypothetical protein
MKVVRIDELSKTEQRNAPGTAIRAAKRRHRREATPPEKFSDRSEILTECTSQQIQQKS